MTAPTPAFFPSCPPWCAGHEDLQEVRPPRWHRSRGEVLPFIERRQMVFGATPEMNSLIATDYVVALEQDGRATYVYVGVLEDAERFMAFTMEGARLLYAALGALIDEAAREA